jgi:F0F1-type ATP synthase assembly protein I
VPRTKQNFDLTQAASLGITLAAVMCLFAYLGYRIDLWLQSSPIGLIAGCLVGLAAGMTYVIRKVSEISRGGGPDEPR